MVDILQFYAFSADKQAGKGVGDFISNPAIYTELNKISNWRRMFSSLWSKDPFKFDGLTFQSYEHAYQYLKFTECGFAEFGYSFSLESNSGFSCADGIEARKHRKDIRIPKEKLQLWEDQLDVLKDRLYTAKYSLETRPGRALTLTQNAELINSGPRIRKIRCTRLERFRKLLQEK